MRRNAIALVATATTCMVLALTALPSQGAAVEHIYPDTYDHIDVEAILDNKRKRENYYNCFLGTAPCATADARFFKERFPEAIVTKCKKCTSRQKDNFGKIITYYTEKEPEKWKAVVSKAVIESRKKSQG